MTIRTNWSLKAVAALALATVTTSCTQTSSQPPQESHAAAAAAEPEMHGPPGPELLVFAALHHLELSPAQKATLETTAHTLAPAQPPLGGLLGEVAAGVRAGQLDEARVLAKLDAAAPVADHAAAVTSALTTLHTTLTADQLRALVDTISKKIDEHEANAGGMAGGAAHDQMLQHLVSMIDVTAAQRAQIDQILAAQVGSAPPAAVANMQAFHADLRTRLQTFVGDQFDAAAFANAFAAVPTAMRGHMQHAIHALAAILPVLDQAQREALAGKIEMFAMHGM